MEAGMETGWDGETVVERERQREVTRQKGSWEWVLGFGVVAAFGRMLVGGADFAGPYLAVLPTCSVCVSVCVCVCVCACMCVRVCLHNSVGLLRFPPNIFSLTRHLNDVILNYVFFVEIPLIQFGCLLLVCPLLCFFLPSVVVYLSSFT